MHYLFILIIFLLTSCLDMSTPKQVKTDYEQPLDNVANLQFLNDLSASGDNIDVSWKAFSDSNLANHKLVTFTDKNCLSGMKNHGYTESSSNSDNDTIRNLTDGRYWAKVIAVDNDGNTEESECSADSILIDLTAPTDMGANLNFFDIGLSSGNNIAVSWTGFVDTNLSHYKIFTYTDIWCFGGEVDHGSTGNVSNFNNTIIDGLADGTYYAKVVAYDLVGNYRSSSCSSDRIKIDTVIPTITGADPTFSNTIDDDGENIELRWDGHFTEENLYKNKIFTYTDSTCSGGEQYHGEAISSSTTREISINQEDEYWFKVAQIDVAGNETVSNCSSNKVSVDLYPPMVDWIGKITLDATNDGSNIEVKLPCTFIEPFLYSYSFSSYTNSQCSGSMQQQGLELVSSHDKNTFTFSSTLAEGTHWFKTFATDIAGRTISSHCFADYIIVDSSSLTVSDPTSTLLFSKSVYSDGTVVPTWSDYLPNAHMSYYEVSMFQDSTCSTGSYFVLGPIPDGTIYDTQVDVTGLSDGTYWYQVLGHSSNGNTGGGQCSTNYAVLDTTFPVDAGADPTFTNLYNLPTSTVPVNWTAFTDNLGVTNHKISTFSDSACTVLAYDHGYTGSSSNSFSLSGFNDGSYWYQVSAIDAGQNSTTSPCSIGHFYVDSQSPIVNSMTLTKSFNPGVTNVMTSGTGTLDLTWTAFTDTNLSNYEVKVFSNRNCLSPADSSFTTSSTSNNGTFHLSNYSDGAYFIQVTGFDSAGYSTSACSIDNFYVDTTAPSVPASQNFFVDAGDDGDSVSISWSVFSDTNLQGYRISSFTDSACTVGGQVHGTLSANALSDSSLVNISSDGSYWLEIVAIDIAGSEGTACSDDSIVIDSTPATTSGPIIPTFSVGTNLTGNNIIVDWTNSFSDSYLISYTINLFDDSSCTSLVTSSGVQISLPKPYTFTTLSDKVYWAQVEAKDIGGNSTYSKCSSSATAAAGAYPEILVDSLAPDGALVSPLFSPSSKSDGSGLQVSWTSFVEQNPSDQDLIIFSGTGCTTADSTYANLGSQATSTIINISAEGTYSAHIVALDLSGATGTSNCSPSSIEIDLTAPSGLGTISFPSSIDTDGDGVVVNWSPFTGAFNYSVNLFNTSSCLSSVASNVESSSSATSSIFNSLSDGQYWGQVKASDEVGNYTLGACSSDLIFIEDISEIQLNSSISGGENVDSYYKITDDGGKVVYLSNQSTTLEYELFIRNIGGSSSPVRVSTNISSGSYVLSGFELSSDSQYVIYMATNVHGNSETGIYRAQLDGGGSIVDITAGQIDATNFGAVSNLKLLTVGSNDFVVYTANDATSSTIYNLYYARQDGAGGQYSLTAGSVNSGETIKSDFKTLEGSDGTGYVFFRGNINSPNGIELYRASVETTPIVTRISGALSSIEQVEMFDTTSGGTYVTYISDETTTGFPELKRVNQNGTGLTTLSNAGDGIVIDFKLDSDGTAAIYTSQSGSSGALELWYIPVTSASGTKLVASPSSVQNVESSNYMHISGTNYVLFNGDLTNDGVYDLYYVDITDPLTKYRINDRGANSLMSVKDFIGYYESSTATTKIAYVSDQEDAGVYELFYVDTSSYGDGNSKRLHSDFTSSTSDIELKTLNINSNGVKLVFIKGPGGTVLNSIFSTYFLK